MAAPSFYGVAQVDVVETHLSYVFLAGERAYKLKKAVVLPFADYSTVARRRAGCEAEVRLNRRLAPSIYLGVRAIAERPGGLALADASDPGAIDYVVEMRRYGASETLDARLAAGAAGERELAEIGAFIARFHRDAERADATVAARAFERALESTLDDIEASGDGRAHTAQRLRRFASAFLGGDREPAAARAPFAVDGHGDLRAEHVVVDGGIEVVDCVEFDDDLRRRDAASDLAFLLMDLEALGHAEAAVAVLRGYRRHGGDTGPPALLAFYEMERAAVRAKVALVRAAQVGAPDADPLLEEADRLLALARRYAWRARGLFVLVICGLSGSGKTHLARAVAEVAGIPVLSSDRVRKELAGIDPHDRAGAEHYTAEFSVRTYEELGRRAAAACALGSAAVADGTFRSARDREAFARGLGSGPPDVLFARCEAPLPLLRARLSERPGDVSDATVEVLDAQTFEELDEVSAERRVTLRTDRAAGEVVADLEDWLDQRLYPVPGPGRARMC